ncbi:hypothetical protein F4780DRAFT_779145 [Xylariomycetidae sp. FL0641]|nr:hypothetical protein F4780DRAFT_779145 [Xylariomycetidae sp. FL0641]
MGIFFDLSRPRTFFFSKGAAVSAKLSKTTGMHSKGEALFAYPEDGGITIMLVAKTTDGRDGTIAFRFNPDSDDLSQVQALPSAQTILVIFPLKGARPSGRNATVTGNGNEQAIT